MRDIEKQEIEELLSAYVDGVLSDRRRMEVRRLVENDAEAEALLQSLEKQKALLNAMPVASAPAGLAQRVLAAAAQSEIRPRAQAPVLSTAASRHAGERQLLMRRILTAAAMIFAPVLILCLVVWGIIGPLSEPGGTARNAPVPPALTDPSPGPAVSFPLSASLYLTTSQPTQMNSFVHKAIYNHDLTSHATTIGLGIAEQTYEIRADRGRIVALLGELATVWDKCEATAMTVHGRTMALNARIDGVRADQAIALYQGDVFRDPLQYARQMDRMNRLMQGLPDYPGGPGLPVMPQLASGQRIAASTLPDKPDAYVTLFINIQSY